MIDEKDIIVNEDKTEDDAPKKRYTDKTYNTIDLESVQIRIASPERIRAMSYGEVTKVDTINYRTYKPEAEGLFCQKIFGPVKDWECDCGKRRQQGERGLVCDKCGVKITKSSVRRERMGHIELAVPVAHYWYTKGSPSRISQLLGISSKDLTDVVYYNRNIVINPGSTGLNKYDLVSDSKLKSLKEDFFYDEEFECGTGAPAIKKLLEELDLDALLQELREQYNNAKESSRQKILPRYQIVEAFRQSGQKPSSMILEVIPVLPPDLRPMVQLEGGRFTTSDLNELYKLVVYRNIQLKKLKDSKLPDVCMKFEAKMLQEAVDALISNDKLQAIKSSKNSSAGSRTLKCLSEMLSGKTGRFRQNLLGKRVDYSGRSVIVVGPELKMYQCGLPKEMAIELFKPFVMRKMVELGYSTNHKSAKKAIENGDARIWDALDIVIKDHPVMLNRAPTLHRLGIQAFEPVLVEGRAIKLHPLVCTAFNADFDGDQMAVHVPLSAEAQTEARVLMLAANNLLKPADGKPVTVPTQDMILGSYYLTTVRDDEKGTGHVYRDVDEAFMAYDAKELQLHAPIKVRMRKEINGKTYSAIVPTTLGQIIFNKPVPQDLGYVTRDENDPVSMLRPEVDFLINKKTLGKLIDRVILVHGVSTAATVLDEIKAQGYKFSTKSGTTVSVFDAWIPESKAATIAETKKSIEKITALYNRGRITEEERRNAVISAWTDCTKKVTDALVKNLDTRNPIHMMIDSGARGNNSQMSQLAGMRGLLTNAAGETIEAPITANYREGLTVRDYFVSSRGARKGLADTALRTADSGYLTRRLVDVSHEIVIRETDCHCKTGFEVFEIKVGDQVLEKLDERLTGRYLLNDLVDEATGEVIMTNDRMMTEEDAKRIIAAGITRVTIRSVLTCEAEHGICVKCYGKDLATGKPVSIGEAVGVIAAQSIGEPGTQLTMRTFHTGGAATVSDITQGLPRVVELFEDRKPKKLAIISEISGEVAFKEQGKKKLIEVSGEDGTRVYTLVFGMEACVVPGQQVEKGDPLTKGSMYPKDVLNILGVNAVRNYLITEVHNTYRNQGVEVNDKHIEIIVHQMMKTFIVSDPGTTTLLKDQSVLRSEYMEANRKAKAAAEANGTEFRPVEVTPTILGIAKAALASESFLSSTSFQETPKILTEASIYGRTDLLRGLKENVITGRLVPCGTGVDVYHNVDIMSTTGEDLAHVHDPANIDYSGNNKNY